VDPCLIPGRNSLSRAILNSCLPCESSPRPKFANKRTAFAAAYTFLAINGVSITADASSTGIFLCDLYDSNVFTFDRLVPWLRNNVTWESPL
jgi:hypothetical protein